MVSDTHLTHISPTMCSFSAVKPHAPCILLIQEFTSFGYPRRMPTWIKDAIRLKNILSKSMASSRTKGIYEGLEQVIVQGMGLPIPNKSCHCRLHVLTALEVALLSHTPTDISESNPPTLRKRYFYGNNNKRNHPEKTSYVLPMWSIHYRFHLSRKLFVDPPSLPPNYIRSLLYILKAFCSFPSHHLITPIIK